jgi:hypothetical protein
MIDLTAARTFMDTHARVLDRRRLAVLLDGGPPDGALDALRAYRNADGGFGWALEADLRAPSSQPAGALHAFEVLEEVAPATSDMAPDLCAWLDAATLDDGGLPFSVAGAATPGTAPWWAGADPSQSSLHITAAVVAAALAVAAHDQRVASHTWLARATGFCRREIAARHDRFAAYELRFSIELLDALAAADPGARGELERLVAFVPASGELPVEGGLEDERLRALDLSPRPGRPSRELLPAAAVERHLDRLEGGQQEDGGWPVEWQPASPGAAFEWRGALTLKAIALLRANGRLD